MTSFRTGVVAEISSTRRGLQRLIVDVDGQSRRAYVLTQLIGDVAVGDRVVVNTTAADLELGTGGWDVVHWNLSRESVDTAGRGHVMKLRYTSLQADTGVAEEESDFEPPPGLGGLPVVVCGLHSQLAPVAAAFRTRAPDARLAYVMTDTAALPLALSDLVAGLVDRGVLDSTITAGQAFGGDHEAVNVRSALDVAVVRAKARAVVVAPGPGGVGTASPHGFGALEVAANIGLASAGRAQVIVAVRWSDADERERHRGLSHHTLTALTHAGASAVVAVPRGASLPTLPGGHRIQPVDVPDPATLLAASGITVTTMGRSPAEDAAFFTFAAAAGLVAAEMLHP